jgi:hypothetical protein
MSAPVASRGEGSGAGSGGGSGAGIPDETITSMTFAGTPASLSFLTSETLKLNVDPVL